MKTSAKDSKADIEVGNAVIYVIDTVLRPS